jgi:hypothetical protein
LSSPCLPALALQVFSEHIMQGVGIVVTDENKVTGANFSLRNPDEVATFLSSLVESRRKYAGAFLKKLIT